MFKLLVFVSNIVGQAHQLVLLPPVQGRRKSPQTDKKRFVCRHMQ